MGGRSPELHSGIPIETCPLIMEREDNLNIGEHAIDMPRSAEASVSGSRDRTSSILEASAPEERPLGGARSPQPPTSGSSGSNVRSASLVRRNETRRRRSPLNSGLWISVELGLTVSQIIAAIVVLAVSRREQPHAPLRAWIVGYASGCVATLPLLYWRYRHRIQVSEQDSAQSRQGSPHISVPAGPFSVSVRRTSEGDDRRTANTLARGGHNAGILTARLKVLVEYFKMALDCFFAVWFVVGNVWIFGGHASSVLSPILYRLCIVFLAICCIGYAMPFILCATICCCLPCIISVLGFREDLAQTRGATLESIDALPTYKFKSQRNRNNSDRDGNSASSDGGIVAAGTEKERVISGEDAVCCICLAKYANNDELKELPCAHFFHKECVDKWLKINATCPLCKSEAGESVTGFQPAPSSGQRRVESTSRAGTVF